MEKVTIPLVVPLGISADVSKIERIVPSKPARRLMGMFAGAMMNLGLLVSGIVEAVRIELVKKYGSW